MIEKMIEIINEEIEIAVKYFEIRKENDWIALSKIRGMIEMLEIASGKEYEFDENGVFEKHI